jgi:hypothetical protein
MALHDDDLRAELARCRESILGVNPDLNRAEESLDAIHDLLDDWSDRVDEILSFRLRPLRGLGGPANTATRARMNRRRRSQG